MSYLISEVAPILEALGVGQKDLDKSKAKDLTFTFEGKRVIEREHLYDFVDYFLDESLLYGKECEITDNCYAISKRYGEYLCREISSKVDFAKVTTRSSPHFHIVNSAFNSRLLSALRKYGEIVGITNTDEGVSVMLHYKSPIKVNS